MLGDSEHAGFYASEVGCGTQQGNDGFMSRAIDASEPSGSGIEHGQVGDTRLQHIIVQQRKVWPEDPGTGEKLADSGIQRPQRNEFGKSCNSHRGGQKAHGPVTELCSLFAPGPSDPRWPDIIREHPERAPALVTDFRQLVNGLAFAMDDCRAARLKCAGNGVVALQAGCAAAVLVKRSGILKKEQK